MHLRETQVLVVVVDFSSTINKEEKPQLSVYLCLHLLAREHTTSCSSAGPFTSFTKKKNTSSPSCYYKVQPVSL